MSPDVLAELRRHRVPAQLIQALELVGISVEQLKARCDAQEKTIAAQAELIDRLRLDGQPTARHTRRWPFLSGGLGKRR